MPEKFKGRAPEVRRVDGLDRWFIGDKDFGTLGGNVIAKNRDKLLGRLSHRTYDEIHPGSYQVKPRLEEMDKQGIWAQICFQNGGVTQGGSLVSLNDPELSATIIRMYNDACIDRMQVSGDRVNCMATLPYWDQKFMVSELRRVIDGGIRGVVMPDRPERLGEPYLGADGKVNPFWAEAFEMCEASGVPLVYHLNSALDANSAIWDNLGFDQKLPIHALLHHAGCAATLSNFIVSGLLDTYEDLKIGLIESGMGWVPFMLESVDHVFGYSRVDVERPEYAEKPSRYFHRQVSVCAFFEEVAPQRLIDVVGADNVLFETDYPHPVCLYGNVREKIDAAYGDLPHDLQRKVLWDNAAALYRVGAPDRPWRGNGDAA